MASTRSAQAILDDLKLAAHELRESAGRRFCEELLDGLEGETAPLPAGQQKELLDLLRKCRWFELMEVVGTAIVGTGQATDRTRKQLGQALVELKLFDEALAVLEALQADPGCSEFERSEAGGLIGRVHKQLYVDRSATLGPARRSTLEASIRAYYDVYVSDRGKYTWQGINAVAMHLRGVRDGVRVPVTEDPQRMAEAILAAARASTEHWDLATSAEACIALQRWSDARDFMEKYVQHAGLDSFSAASTLRQLREVWQLREDGDGGELLSILQVAVMTIQGKGPLAFERARAPLSFRPGELETAEFETRARRAMLEKVFGKAGPRSVEWFKRGMSRANGVARVETALGQGVGTAFLLRADRLFKAWKDPDELLLVTNAHVVSTTGDEALRPDEAVVRFEALEARRTFHISEVLFESPPESLDVTIARLDAAVTGVEPFELAPQPEPVYEPTRGRELYIIGHPMGGALSISIQDNQQIGWLSPRIHYRTPTQPGNSGSPVFDDDWRLVAVHHAGSTEMRRLDGTPGTYEANEGIWIHAIRGAIAEREATGPIRVEHSSPAVSLPRRVGIFVCYSHRDLRHLESLRTHLVPIVTEKEVEAWDDRQIAAGDLWRTTLRDKLDHACVAILMVSSGFMASNFIRNFELPSILDANEKRGLRILPISVSAATLTPELEKRQFVNDPRRPLDLLAKARREREWVEIVKKIHAQLDAVRLGNGLRAMDMFSYQAAGLGGRAASERRLENFGAIARQGSHGIVMRLGPEQHDLMRLEEIEKLDPQSRQLIKAHDEAIAQYFERFVASWPNRTAADSGTRERAKMEIEESRRALCDEFRRLLAFFQSLGKSLDDHYQAVRHICDT